MKIYGKKSVFDAALDRIRYIFDEFPVVVVGISGGKDSTVLYHLAMQVAKEKNRLPLRVFFLDQELEFASTIEIVKEIMYNPDVHPMWMQIPFDMPNSTSNTEIWLHTWGEGEKWVREKDPISIKENKYGVDKFVDMFGGIFKGEFKNQKACYLSGVTAEESPARYMATTTAVTYKWATFGKILDKKMEHYTFYPIYDWSYIDVWKAIHDNNWHYSRHYDEQYQYGVPLRRMRVSNYHHETALQSLYFLQEVEPDTYEAATQRLAGLDTVGKFGSDYFVYDLPFMFKDWQEYRDYLLENLVTDPMIIKRLTNKFKSMDEKYADMAGDKLYRVQISSILVQDFDLTKLKNWEVSSFADDIRKAKRAKAKKEANASQE